MNVIRPTLFFLFLGLISIIVSLNPYHACIDQSIIQQTYKSNTFTACVSSPNTYDYDSDISKDILNVPVHFYFPNSPKKVPVIIISHGAGGIFQFHHDYKNTFLSNGYGVAIIDHFSPRNIAIDFDFVKVTEAMMLSDVSATLKYLIENYSHRIDGQIGYIGWSKGGISTLSLRSKKVYDKYIPENITLSFLGGIYTLCNVSFENYESSNIPLLLISGKLDEITPSKHCEKLFKEYRDDEDIIYYELDEAHHGFDNHFFLLGAYLPWQPILIDSDICKIQVNKSLMTQNKNGTYSLNDYASRKEFIKACTQRGAFVQYDYTSKIKSQKLILDFVSRKFIKN